MSNVNINMTNPTRLVYAAILMTGILLPVDRAFSVDERKLSFYHTHTHETDGQRQLFITCI